LNFAAQKFFVGLVDFFSIFLPGATLAYVIRDWVYSTFLGPNMHPPIDRGEAGLVFLFGSYLLGHLIFLLAAILDERIYHPLRALTDWKTKTCRRTGNAGLPLQVCCLAPMPTRPSCRRNE
jgi:hypothetical protein